MTSGGSRSRIFAAFSLAIVMALQLNIAQGSSSYASLNFYSGASCTGTNTNTEIYTIGSCYTETSTSFQYTTVTDTSGTVSLVYTTYSDTACATSTGSNTVTQGQCDVTNSVIPYYTTSIPTFSSVGFLEYLYTGASCSGEFLAVWLRSGSCADFSTSSEKAVCSGGQATLTIWGTSTTCSGTGTPNYDQVFSTCTPVTTNYGQISVVSLTSSCTGSSSNNNGSVGSLTGEQVIWAMIGVLVGAALLFAALFTFFCPTCIKTGFGGESTTINTNQK